MLKLTDIAAAETSIDEVLTLPFELRQKCRQSVTTDSGLEVGLFVSRGQILRSGLILTGPDAISVLIKAAPEAVTVMRSNDMLQFARACYHLGNRHVPLQILKGELRYLQDHVLDHMLQSMGYTLHHDTLPFEPEAGAYHIHDH